MPQTFSPNTVSESEIVTIQHTHPNCWTIRYEWSDDLDPDGRICSIEWRLTFKDALEAAHRQLMFDTRIPGLKSSVASNQPRSCFTCQHIKTWHHAATHEEPEDSGWECAHPDQKIAIQDITPSELCSKCRGTGLVDREATSSVKPELAYHAQSIDLLKCACVGDDETIAQLIAAQCPGYKYYERNLQEEPPSERLTPEEFEELAILEAETQQARYLQLSYLDPDGTLTPHYFEVAQQNYEKQKGK